MFERGTQSGQPIDQLRPGLLHVVLHRIRAFNASTRLLLRLLEEPDWKDLGSRACAHVRKQMVH